MIKEHGLAFHKDLAVSLPSFYPYNGTKPTYNGDLAP